jgi:release factor glutamine methyltransferase
LRRLPGGAAAIEANALLGFVLDKPQSYLYAWPERTLEAEALNIYTALVRRRAAGEPLAYITGRREFWSLDLDVSPATLVPRPETELLVERALRHIPVHRAWKVVDLGTGSGAVALAIASERPHCRVIATDASCDALEVTRQNICRLALSNVKLVQGNWYEPLPRGDRFDMIVSNPPYVASGDPHLSRGDLAWEPATALQAGADGLDAIKTIARQASDHLSREGWLLLEHGCDQGLQVRDILRRAGFHQVQTHLDLAGHERVTEGKP